MTVASVTSSASPVYLIVGPSRSRTSARPKPRRRPSPRPSAMLRLGLGLNGTGSTGALRTRVALTGLAWLGATRSSWFDRGRELLADGLGVAACWALASLTVISMRTVFSGDGRGHVGGQLVRRRGELELVDHGVEHFGSLEELGVRLDPLLGEGVALQERAVVVGTRGGDEGLGLSRVRPRGQRRQHHGGADHEHRHQRDDAPALAKDTEIVPQFHERLAFVDRCIRHFGGFA